MTEYVHHIPGRLRIRSKALRSAHGDHTSVLRRLRDIHGVQSVRLNQKAACVTVCYDPQQTCANCIFETLGHADQARAASQPARKPSSNRGQFRIASQVGKMALNVLVSRGVNYSLSALLSKGV